MRGIAFIVALMAICSVSWAECVDKGLGEQVNFNNCLVAAKSGNAESQVAIGTYYMYKEGGDATNTRLAIKWFRVAAEQGNANGQYMLGIMYSMSNELWVPQSENERGWYEKAANQGHADAQLRLGLDYMYGGRDMKESPVKAMEWILKSATNGNAEAGYIMGRAYRDGDKVLQDYKEAVKWFRQSANQRDNVISMVYSQDALGFMHRDGLGVEMSYVLAHMWWNLASSFGGESSAKERDAVAKKMSTAQVNKAQELAKNWRPNSE